jgi:hypothetical protein
MLGCHSVFARSAPLVRRESVAAGMLSVLLLALATRAGAQQAGAGVYVRTDSDRTTVITPRVRAAAPVGEATRVDVVYTVDVWTSASIDIRTSASKAVTEQRDEIDASATHEQGDLTLTGGYRYSTEPDYESHGGSLGLAYDLADNSATLALNASATFDEVGRVGDPRFARDARVLSARASYTQVLDPETLVQAIYEYGLATGFLSSPYRYVGIGSADGGCRLPPDPIAAWAIGASRLSHCLPERSPDERWRHAIALRGRRALGEAVSIGADYRFYIDGWELSSHTANVELAWSPAEDTVFGLRYRFYLQSAAAHYRPRFATLQQAGDHFTRDKELSPLSGHRLMLDFERGFRLDDLGHMLRAVLSVGPSIYLYTDFPPLDRITALEVTLAAVMEL